MKRYLAIIGLSLLALSANASTVLYNVVNGVAGNQFTQSGGGFADDAPLFDVSGMFVYDTDADALVGNVAFNYFFEGFGGTDSDYSANWVVNFQGGGDLVAFDVSCVNNAPNDGCADLTASNPFWNDAMSVLSGDLAAGSDTTIKWLVGGAPFNSSLIALDLRVVPIPAAAWLFGTALGLLGWVRSRTT